MDNMQELIKEMMDLDFVIVITDKVRPKQWTASTQINHG